MFFDADLGCVRFHGRINEKGIAADGESGWQMLALPVRVFFFGQDDLPQYFDGVLNPLLILLLPWAFKGKWRDEKRFLFGFALLYFLFALFLVDLRIRYILPMVPPLVILLTYGIHNVYLRIAHPSWLWAVVIVFLVWNGTYLVSYYQRVAPLPYLSGRQSRGDYLRTRLPEFSALEYINAHAPPDSRVYFLFTGNRGYYCEREYFYDPGHDARFLVRGIRDAGDANRLREELMRQRLTHLLVREDLLKRHLADNLTAEERKVWHDFASLNLRLLFRDGAYSVYGIHA